MDNQFKIVTSLPLQELWRDVILVKARQRRALTAEDIRDLLRSGPVQFVMADIGAPLYWIPLDERFNFWKDEVLAHIAFPDSGVHLNSFPGSYCYFASEWSTDEATPTVVLEKHH